MTEVSLKFNAEGCDIAVDMLKECPPTVRAFHLDIAASDSSFFRLNEGHWDILFMRGVMLYLIDNPKHAAYAMNNMMLLAAKKILVWEWAEVCARSAPRERFSCGWMLRLSLQRGTREKLAGKRRARSRIDDAHALSAADPERLVNCTLQPFSPSNI